jgi:predicted RNA binding protein YcfA (HicA-like mRNA interferase family)
LFTFVLPNKSIAMKCSELLRLLKKAGWMEISQKGSHIKMKHDSISDTIIFPNHGSQELGKGLELKIKKIARL